MEDRKRFCKKCEAPLEEKTRFCAKKIIVSLLSLIAICIIAAGIFVIAGGTGNQTLDVGEYTANPSALDEYLSKNDYKKDSDGVYESPDKQVRVELDERGAPKQILIAGGDTTIFGIGIGDTFYINTIGKKLTSRGYGLSDEDDMSVTYSTEFPGGIKGVQLFVKTDTQKIYNIIYYMEKDSDESKTDESLQESTLAETFGIQEGNSIYRKTGETPLRLGGKEQGDVGDTDEDEYILPNSDIQLISGMGAFVQNMPEESIRLAKNEIYARHERRFKDPALQAYFDAKSWYIGSIEPEDFNESVLNEIERKNIEILNSMLKN